MAKRRKWPWPKEPTPPFIADGSWTQRHPTRYYLQDDVRRVTLDFFDTAFGNEIRPNTYVDHPEWSGNISWGEHLGFNSQARSVDFWGKGGRGDPVGREHGSIIVRRIFNDPNPPWIYWVIWRGMIWTHDTGEWRVWHSDGTGAHFDHPHFTFMPRALNIALSFAQFPGGISPGHARAIEQLDQGWEDEREAEFWSSRPDDGERYIMAEGVWVPVAA